MTSYSHNCYNDVGDIMLSKQEETLKKLNRTYPLACPTCNTILSLNNRTLKCEHNHTFDVAKKGYLNLIQKSQDNMYNKELFKARRHILNIYYTDFIKTLSKAISKVSQSNDVLLDAGCGEGTYLHRLKGKKKIGIDNSQAAIQMATDYRDGLFLVADLANLPLQNKSVDLLLNILSPANYQEFKRVLKDDAYLVKVIPNHHYLEELRTQENDYQNKEVIQHLKEHFKIVHEENYYQQFKVEKDDQSLFSLMTPLNQHQHIQSDFITLDLKILIAKKK